MNSRIPLWLVTCGDRIIIKRISIQYVPQVNLTKWGKHMFYINIKHENET